MNEWLTIGITVAIGATIGGFTNQLAVRMLFRPYKPWMLGRYRVPFTPGLIPRRREELGQQMGYLVEHYLLTAEGVKRAIVTGDLQKMLTNWLTGHLEELLHSKRTLRDVIKRAAPDILAEDGRWSNELRERVQHQWDGWIREWLKRVGRRRLRELLPPEAEGKLNQAAASLSEQLLVRFRGYLRSLDGVQQIQSMLRGFIGGGMFGGLVGMFLADDKMVAKILMQVDESLENPQLARKLSDVIRQEADRLLDKPLQEVLDWIGEPQLIAWSRRVVDYAEERSIHLVDKPIADSLGQLPKRMIEEWVPRLAEWIVQVLQQNVERLFHKLEVAKIVARQVEGFPLERVEEMIIGISGKEFRMITLLGFLLGGAIGLVQGFLNLWL
ncbi:DUF445 family protein [Brevibacillus humidisoli]|uniref:DUF445 domain-containing protein n=1 Tax=Brevibacillus humidisoli TaxID=2895522 RepID=UPI001E344221|nr:DUF445 family protein [Brevibacillus humidisoli]UFJ41510.1 DUF445 family protein [Brevibacillus humidisoli]